MTKPLQDLRAAYAETQRKLIDARATYTAARQRLDTTLQKLAELEVAGARAAIARCRAKIEILEEEVTEARIVSQGLVTDLGHLARGIQLEKAAQVARKHRPPCQ